MQLPSVVGLAVVAAVLCTVLKRCYPEYATALALLTGVMILLAVCSAVMPVLHFLKRLSELVGLQDDILAMALKMVGLCWVSALGADVCRDAGQTGLASKVELAGRIAVLLAILPAFENLMSLAGTLIGMRTS